MADKNLNGTVILQLRDEKKSRPISKVLHVTQGEGGWVNVELESGHRINLSPDAVRLVKLSEKAFRHYEKLKARAAVAKVVAQQRPGNSMVATKIVVFPNPNNDEETGYKNCWTCDHAGPQEPKENGSLILCEACGDLLDVPGAQVVDESGKPVQWGKSNPDGTLRAAGAGQ
jgi:hypothetical protein